MDDFTKSIITIVVVCGVGSALIIGSLIYREMRIDTFTHQLESRGVSVMRGVIESPSVIIGLSKSEFLLKVAELDSTVYKYMGAFYIFEENMLVAYRYVTPIW